MDKNEIIKPWKEMSRDELKQEFLKCKEDPIYFISNYIKVVHPLLGLVPFELFPFQERIVGNLVSHRFNVLNKFRQAGCTTLACAFAVWIIIFQKHKEITCMSIGDKEAMEILNRIKVMYDELPPFLKPKKVKGGDNKHTLELSTGSKITSKPSAKNSGRGLSGFLVIFDEAAFIEYINDIWAAAYPTISTGGKILVLSTVNGMGNFYHNLYTEALQGKNDFNVIDIEWKEHPQYFYNPEYEHLYAALREREPTFDVSKFEETTKKNIGLKRWRQEFEKEFLGTGDTYVDPDILKLLFENKDENYFIKYNNRLRVWKDPEPLHEYIIGADPSLGRELDYSAAVVFDLYDGDQVAEFYSNKTPINDFAHILAEMGNLYNIAVIIPERNTIGNNLIDCLLNLEEYENVWVDEKGDPGLQVTASNNEQLLADMEEAVRNKRVIIRSERIIRELFTFIITENGRPEADSGQNDDLVCALKTAVHGINKVLEKSPMIMSRISTTYGKEPLGIIAGDNVSGGDKYISNKYFNGVSLEDVKWLLSK